MRKAITDIAKNASVVSESSAEAMQIALEGNKVAEEFRKSAEKRGIPKIEEDAREIAKELDEGFVGRKPIDLLYE